MIDTATVIVTEMKKPTQPRATRATRATRPATFPVYGLPNHRWTALENAKLHQPENVLRQTKWGALVRERTWNLETRWDFSKEWCGANRPNDTWKPVDIWIEGDAILSLLAQKAKDGNADAAQELARLASTATVLLSQVCKAKPELLRPLARMKRQWPVIKKKNAELSDEEKDLFNAIQLGADDFIELDAQTAKWRFDDAGIIAYSLLDYIRRARGDKATIFNYGPIGNLAGKKLPREFDEESAPDWWDFAKGILLATYPEPHAIEELKNLVPVDSPKRKSPGRLDQAIFRKLKSRFLAFARNSSFD